MQAAVGRSLTAYPCFLPASLVRLRSTTCGFAASRGFAAAPAALPALPARGPLLSRPADYDQVEGGGEEGERGAEMPSGFTDLGGLD